MEEEKEGKNQAERNMKNENWLQKLIYRISDNKFNSFSLLSFLFSLQNLLFAEEVGRSKQLKNYR